MTGALCMNFGSLTRDFLLVKTSFPMGFAVGINFENFTQRNIFAYGAIAQRQKFVISQVSLDLIFSFMFFKDKICRQCFV